MVLVLVMVLQVWCCVVKRSLVTLVVIMILKDTATFQVLFIISLFCACNITTDIVDCTGIGLISIVTQPTRAASYLDRICVLSSL